MEKDFSIISLNISLKKGEQKVPVDEVELRAEHGIVGDAHAGKWHRQVSLLADEDVETMRGKGIDLNPGDFAENITTEGIVLSELPVGTRLYIGDSELEITQIGKKCHHDCAVFHAVGDCVMPRRGIFARVLRGGRINSESSCHYRL